MKCKLTGKEIKKCRYIYTCSVSVCRLEILAQCQYKDCVNYKKKQSCVNCLHSRYVNDKYKKSEGNDER